MSEMVERVAKAICTFGDPASCCGQCGVIVDKAKAAIEAMREPTKEMGLEGYYAMSADSADNVWQAMIDAALK